MVLRVSIGGPKNAVNSSQLFLQDWIVYKYLFSHLAAKSSGVVFTASLLGAVNVFHIGRKLFSRFPNYVFTGISDLVDNANLGLRFRGNRADGLGKSV